MFAVTWGLNLSGQLKCDVCIAYMFQGDINCQCFKNKVQFIPDTSIRMKRECQSLPMAFVLFFLTHSASFCHHFISFVPVRPGPKGRVGSTRARISRPPPISRHLPAWYQSTLYSLPAETQPALRETEGDVA